MIEYPIHPIHNPSILFFFFVTLFSLFKHEEINLFSTFAERRLSSIQRYYSEAQSKESGAQMVTRSKRKREGPAEKLPVEMGRRSETSREGPAEKVPVEVIGDILSRVEVARHVIRASLTCKRWREAYCKYLHALSFHAADFTFLRGQISVPAIELMISKTICQSPGLRKLSIQMDLTFSAGSVYAWLMCVRETLSELVYKDTTSTRLNVLDIFKGQKLERLSLANYKIGRGEMNFQRFPCLTSLSLCRVGISLENLSRVPSALPNLESLKLDAPFQEASNSRYSSYSSSDDSSDSDDSSPEKGVKLCCPTLKTLFLDNMNAFEFILESSSIEHLQMKCCNFGSFKAYGSTSLRDIKISHSEVWHLEIEQTDNLESFEFVSSHVTSSNLFPMMVQSPNLKRFRFWGFKKKCKNPVRRNETVPDSGSGIVLDSEQMAIFSPQLSHLAIFRDKGVSGLVYRFEGSTSSLEKVMVLEIGSKCFKGFAKWAEKLLKCCPNVKKVIVHWVWVFPEKRNPKFLQDLTELTSSMNKMLGKYQRRQMQVSFVYDFDFDFDQVSAHTNMPFLTLLSDFTG